MIRYAYELGRSNHGKEDWPIEISLSVEFYFILLTVMIIILSIVVFMLFSHPSVFFPQVFVLAFLQLFTTHLGRYAGVFFKAYRSQHMKKD